MPIRISGAVAADATIANAVQPPTRGIDSPQSVAIPANWLALCLAGTRVAGCTAHFIESGNVMTVTPTVQLRIQDAALIMSLGLNPVQVASFQAKIDAGVYVGGEAITAELLPITQRKVGVACVPSDGGTLNPWSLAQRTGTLEDQLPTYWHNFSPSPEGTPLLSNGGLFTACLVFLTDYTPTRIQLAIDSTQDDWILTLGEPDARGVSVAQGIAAWGALEPFRAANPQIKFLAPWTFTDGSVPGSWLQLWMSGVLAAGYTHWNAVAMDKYGATNGILQRVDNYLLAFPDDLWITEYAIDTGSSGGGAPATKAQEIPYMQFMSQTFDRAKYNRVKRHYKWLQGPPQYTVNDFDGRALYDNAALPTITAPVWRDCGYFLPM